MKTIIVDDEPKAIELIENYASNFAAIEITAKFRNPIKAIEFINKNEVELVFLDINMPNISGISFSKLISKNINIIFTTAYSEFAVESYEIGAVDYLLKPISFERFTIAVNKILNKAEPETKLKPKTNAGHNKIIFLKSGAKLYQLNINDILFLEKNGNYMNYFCYDKKILVRQTIREALSILPEFFVQIHKSYIIPANKIEYLEKDKVTLKGKKIPLSLIYKDNLKRFIKF